jgi:hypothetical protein
MGCLEIAAGSKPSREPWSDSLASAILSATNSRDQQCVPDPVRAIVMPSSAVWFIFETQRKREDETLRQDF